MLSELEMKMCVRPWASSAPRMPELCNPSNASPCP